MKLPDLNLLVYAVDSSAKQHEPARDWLNESLSGSETFAFSWSVMLGFIRLSTKPAVMTQPLETDQAFGLIDSWLAQPCATIVQPTTRHIAVLRDLLAPTSSAGNLTTDAHLAALAIEHGATLCSADADFSRFPGLNWTNPLD